MDLIDVDRITCTLNFGVHFFTSYLEELWDY